MVLVVFAGDDGKPRPAVVVQSDALTEAQLDSVVVCPMSSHRSGQRHLRVALEASPENGLDQASEVMVEKVVGVARRRIRRVIGQVDAASLRAIEGALLLVLGFAEQR